LTGSFLQLLLGHYSVRFGYQREQNYTKIVPKQGFPNCVPWHISVPRKRWKCAAKVSCFDKKLIKCLVHVAVGFCHHKIGVPWPNPEVIRVP